MDGVHFFKKYDFNVFCEHSTFRRDWRSSAHLLEGFGPHASDPGSPKWLPQAPFLATTNKSTYRRDWRSPGAPITSKWASGLDGVHTFNNVCLCICLYFSASRRDSRSPGTLFDQYGFPASTVCTFLRRPMIIIFGHFQKTWAPLRRENHFGSPGLSP